MVKRRLTRRLFMGGVTAATAGLIAACGAAPTPEPTPKPAAPTVAAPEPTKPAVPTAAPANASGPVALTWDNYQGIGTPYPDETIKAFRNKFPNVTIEHRPLPTSQTDSYP